MSADLPSQIRRGLSDVCDEAGAPAEGAVVPLRRPGPVVRPRWLAPVAAAAGVVAVIATMMFLPRWGGGNAPAPPTGRGSAVVPHIPRRPAGPSLLTASAQDSPPGRAAALIGYDAMPVIGDIQQDAVVGVDGRTYRTVPTDSILAPDGSRVVSGGRGALSVIDLRSGATRNFEPGGTGQVTPAAYSPDGRHVVYLLATKPYNACPCKAVLLDVRTGHRRVLSDHGGRGAAFSPDGRRVALGLKGDVVLMDLDGHELARFSAHGGRLDSGHAWSPDGRLLALSFERRERFRFLDLGSGRLLPTTISGDPWVLLGWADPRHVVTDRGSRDMGGAVVRDVRTGGQRVLSSPPADGQYTDLAGDLVPRLTTVDGGKPDRGPWPAWFEGLVLCLVGIVTGICALVVFGVRRRLGARRGATPDPAAGAASAPWSPR